MAGVVWPRRAAGEVGKKEAAALEIQPPIGGDCSAAIVAALKYWRHVRLCPGIWTIDSIVHVPSDTRLQIDGELLGRGSIVCVGSVLVSGTGTVRMGTAGTARVLVLTAGHCLVQGLRFVQIEGQSNCTAIAVEPSKAGIASLTILGCHIEHAHYGILRRSSFGENEVRDIEIVGNEIVNSTGDGIEWNAGMYDKKLHIAGNTIRDVRSVTHFAGIGIGVAGRKVWDKDQLHNVIIEKNSITNAAQGIHVEHCDDVQIRDNWIAGAFERGDLGDCGGIIVYDSNRVSIGRNFVSKGSARWAIGCLYGRTLRGIAPASRSIEIVGNTVEDAGSIETCSPADPHAEVDVKIAKNIVKEGGIIHRGPGNVFIEQNQLSDVEGPAITLRIPSLGTSYASETATLQLTLLNNRQGGTGASVKAVVPCEYLIKNRIAVVTDNPDIAERFSHLAKARARTLGFCLPI